MSENSVIKMNLSNFLLAIDAEVFNRFNCRKESLGRFNWANSYRQGIDPDEAVDEFEEKIAQSYSYSSISKKGK